MKTIDTYFKKRKRALNLILQKPPEEYTVETFHELRVEIKKVKALFELIASYSKKFKFQKTFKPFKVIFRAAGKVRELQLEQIILEEQPDFILLQKYPNQLKKLENKKIKNFFQIATKSLITKIKGKYPKIIYLISKARKKKINRYQNQTRKEIKKLIHKKNLKKKQLHDLRKRLKAYRYNEKIFYGDSASNLISDKPTLSDLLGEWHDYTVITAHLNKIIASYKLISNEKKYLKNSKAAVTSKRKSLLHKIKETLPQETL